MRGAREWLTRQEEVRGLRVGYFGGGCGTAAALRVAARETEAFGAMVMLGGRPDLVGEVLGQVRTPTLFIAGAGDLLVIEWNRKALLELGGEKDLRVIPGASHMFEEIGVIEDVAELAHGVVSAAFDGVSSWEKGAPPQRTRRTLSGAEDGGCDLACGAGVALGNERV